MADLGCTMPFNSYSVESGCEPVTFQLLNRPLHSKRCVPQSSDGSRHRDQKTADSRLYSADSRPYSADSRPDSADSTPDSADSRPDSAASRPDSTDSRPDSAEHRHAPGSGALYLLLLAPMLWELEAGARSSVILVI
ncbi:hypothetical protein AVEN_107812-1 [Araneus ventricosus]|uniref:Uncharacterized protein n=1 Tax=Araneus ventricosus TaxID=182803 RepID=A0A4Y2ANN3_ARAVE|nr:hypothetical protein AVEN_5873-1 [Araneus ventricosus]GBL81340.1 hypothetical protein AVEN_107812-1 [Araneus ventricosus]